MSGFVARMSDSDIRDGTPQASSRISLRSCGLRRGCTSGCLTIEECFFAKVLAFVVAGLDPATSLRDAVTQCPPKRDCRVKPGNDAEGGADDCAPSVIARSEATKQSRARDLSRRSSKSEGGSAPK